jgi:hypothetical protein
LESLELVTLGHSGAADDAVFEAEVMLPANEEHRS